MSNHNDFSDAQVLDMLDLVAAGNSRAAVADVYGLSKNTVVGLLFRVGRDADRAESTPPPPAGQSRAVKPENCDGGMPARWWVPGLRKQTEREASLRRQGMRGRGK